jgi:hypothetical protein
MADVSIKYKDSTIAELNGTGSKTMTTAGTYCEGDIVVDYTPHFKTYYVTIPTAVAAQYVTLVTGDADVAAHYADEHAMVTVRKVTNNSSLGTSIIVHTNHAFPAVYGFYMNFNVATNGTATIPQNLYTDMEGVPYARCTADGEIKVMAQRMQNNFGGADYIVTFSW